MTSSSNAAMIERLIHANEPWVSYNALIDLSGADTNSGEVKAAYQKMLAHPLVVSLIEALHPWPQPLPLKRAYDPKDNLWKLQTLADFGVKREDARIAAIAEQVFDAQADEGAFLHGGFDHTHSWDTRPYICIAHVMTYALARFGYLDDPRLERAYEQIQGWQRVDGGWHPNKQNLPGNKGETEASCPFGSQNILHALAAHPTLRESPTALNAADYLLTCWARRNEPYRPVGFGIGNDWQKVSYPFVQYGLLKSVDTLANIPGINQDARFQEMLDVLETKRSLDGYWKAESASKAWSEFDFGQKKVPSAWITFLATRSLLRAGRLPVQQRQHL